MQEALTEVLVRALAADGRISSAGLEALVHAPPAIIRSLLAVAGHLVHYGAEPEAERVSALFEQIIAELRRLSPPHEFLPGDQVELRVDLPKLKAGTTMRVLLVGARDLELGHPSLLDDYLIHTVPLSAVRLK